MAKRDKTPSPPPAIIEEPSWCILYPLLSTDPSAAEAIARLLHEIRRAIRSGETELAIATLTAGIETAFEYSREHEAAFRLFERFIDCELTPADEPLNLIKSALKRARLKSADS